MSTSKSNCLATIATSIAVAVALAVPANAALIGTDLSMVDKAISPAIEFTLNTNGLLSESAEPGTRGFIVLAGSRTAERRFRATPQRRKIERRRTIMPSTIRSRNNSGTNTPAPLDCSIESHPDCQPTGVTIPVGYSENFLN